jgi:hypothetical protein
MENTLNPEELSCLDDVLNEYLSDLRTEIHDTDDHLFKLRLKRKEEILRGILVKLERARVAMN